jgi:hypothetical protein
MRAVRDAMRDERARVYIHATDRFGYGKELAITLSLPIITFIALLLVTILVVCVKGHRMPNGKKARCCWAVMERAEMWDVLVFLLLFEYPIIARKSLAAFDCVEYDGVYYLAEDPSIACYESDWWMWAYIAMAGNAFCVGLPIAIICCVCGVKNSRSAAHRRIVQSVSYVYSDECWFMEGVDLLRKYLLTGVIQIAFPREPGQLLFASLVCVMALGHQLHYTPYRDPECDTLQSLLLLQLVLTYFTAGILFYKPSEEIVQANTAALNDSMGSLLLVIVNCMGFAFMLRIFVRAILRLRREFSIKHLTWSDSGAPVRLEPPRAGGGFHVFLSQDPFADSGTAELKSTLSALVPSCEVFLHSEHMRDMSHLERYVSDSDVFVAVLSRDYLGTANCRRELVAALHAKKPMVVIVDTDPEQGGSSINVHEMRAQLEALDAYTCPTEQHRAAERMIATLESMSGDHLVQKRLDTLLGELARKPAATSAATMVQAHFRGKQVRDSKVGGWGKVAKQVMRGKGVLRVTLKHANNLMSADSNGLSDPYVVAIGAGVKTQSKPIKKTLNPVWNDEELDLESTLNDFVTGGLVLKFMDKGACLAESHHPSRPFVC